MTTNAKNSSTIHTGSILPYLNVKIIRWYIGVLCSMIPVMFWFMPPKAQKTCLFVCNVVWLCTYLDWMNGWLSWHWLISIKLSFKAEEEQLVSLTYDVSHHCQKLLKADIRDLIWTHSHQPQNSHKTGKQKFLTAEEFCTREASVDRNIKKCEWQQVFIRILCKNMQEFPLGKNISNLRPGVYWWFWKRLT